MKPLSARIEGEGVTSQSDRRVVKQTSKIISTYLGYEVLKDKLNGMGISVSAVTLIHEKKLSESDCNGQSRLLLPKSIEDSPLFHMLTEAENQLVRTGNSKDDGLQVLTLDRHGRSYHMRFKYLGCTKAYRLIGQWGQLVAQNGLRSGDLVELGAFRRVDGQLMFTLLHFAKSCEASQAKETEPSKEELPSRQDTEVSKASMLTEVAKEDSTSMEIDENKEGWTSRETLASKEDWSSRELEAAVALFILSGVEDDTKQ